MTTSAPTENGRTVTPMAELKPMPCPICGMEFKRKVTVRGEVVFDHPRNEGCDYRGKRLRTYDVYFRPVYAEHDAAYLAECISNLADKGIYISSDWAISCAKALKR